MGDISAVIWGSKANRKKDVRVQVYIALARELFVGVSMSLQGRCLKEEEV